jgi:hypothetical protein
MKIPKYIQRKRTKGFRLPKNTLCCTRPGKWSNPWKIGNRLGDGRLITTELCKLLYEDYLKHGVVNIAELLNYYYLACWCPEDAEYCHVQHSLIPKLKELYETNQAQ